MRPSILRAIVAREFEETLRNRLLVSTIVIPPVFLTIAPLLLGALISDQALPDALARQVLEQRPEWAALSQRELAGAFAVQQFLLYFLMMPAYIPLAIATFSIIGEKQSRSLEAVLATPVRTAELLGGKAISALLPGLAAGWITYLVFVALSGFVYSPRLAAIVADATWLAGVFVLGPAIGLASVVAGVITSSRVNDPRVAQQIGGIIIVPIVALTVLQATGTVLVGVTGYLIAAAIVAAISLAGLRLGVRLFDRESILTRWR